MGGEMTRDDIIRMAREAWLGDLLADGVIHNDELERFAALVAAAEREKVAQWMIQRSYATGHGDTIEDLLNELEWQVAERERKACAELARSCDPRATPKGIAAAIRAKGET